MTSVFPNVHPSLSPAIAPEQHASPSALRAESSRLRVGVFDSGVGGLSVLHALRRALPRAELRYVADAAHAPYGDRSPQEIRDRTERLADHFREQGTDLMVIACNTATAEGVATLRARHPHWPLVGVEPGIKPAAALSRARRIGVLATTRTLSSQKFRDLARAHAGDCQLLLQPCPGLADAIERGDLDDPTLRALVDRYCAPLREAGVDVAVLGCTHYPFARPLIEAALPGVQLVDTSEAVARQAARLAGALGDGDRASAPLASPSATPSLSLASTGPTEALQRAARHWLGIDQPVAHCPA